MSSNEHLRPSSSKEQKLLTTEGARDAVVKMGETVDRVEQFDHFIEGKRVTCFSVHLPDRSPGYIVRSDTGVAYKALEFWELFSEFDKMGFPESPNSSEL